MNRIEHFLDQDPEPHGSFSDDEAVRLLLSYCYDPSNVQCPLCGPGTMQVLAFIEPKVEDGMATVRAPRGDYAAVLYCGDCKRTIGIRPVFMDVN
jgi:hypothetical protein